MEDHEFQDRLIEMRLQRIVLRDLVPGVVDPGQAIYLVEKGGKRGFAIVIGTSEAAEIQRVVTNTAPPRPLTHQLAHSMLDALGARIDAVEIVDLRDNTFIARILLGTDSHSEPLMVDARPSDAIALALRAGCPLRVKESVLEEARADESGPDALPGPGGPPEEGGPTPPMGPGFPGSMP